MDICKGITGFARAGIAGAAVVTAFAAGVAQAQDEFPSGPIEIVNMSSPGGGTDIFLRMLAICAGEELGTEIVPISKTGGLGAAALNYAANRERDGHTLIALNPGMYLTASQGNTPVGPDELIPLVRGTEDPQFLIAKKDGPIPDAETLLKEGRERPVKMGGTHIGGTDWVAGMAFAEAAEFNQPLYVPFGGGADILTNVIGGNIEVGILNYSEAEAQIEAGEVVPLVVMSDRRFARSPDTPTSVELDVPATMATLRGVGALRGVPEDRLEKLEQAFLKAMECPQYQEYLTNNGLGEDSIAGAEAFGRQVREFADMFTEQQAKQSGQ